MSVADSTLTLSLISHTNVGKTALARTLLSRDVGEVRDEAHVTLEPSRYTMLRTEGGDELALWDTPGFGDSARLARRLAQQGNPIGWFLSQVWDRFRDRPLWLSQQAVRNVRDHADVVLYLVNASEEPHDAGYLAPELQVLAWIGKPVIALLNQTGPPQPVDGEPVEVTRWRDALGARSFIAAVLPLDAFARCWVQETRLLREVARAVSESKRELAARLASAWHEQREAQFRAAMASVARPIALAACDGEMLPEADAGGVRRFRQWLGLQKEDRAAGALSTLAQRLEQALRESMDELIRIHELEGRAAVEVLGRMKSDVALQEPVDEAKSAVLGGVVSGALSGLAADLALGGLTLGAGVIAGGVLGALGGAGLARGYNLVTGRTGSRVQWSERFLDGLVEAAILRYLAVAHYGRGRGGWSESEYPRFWRDVVARAVASRQAPFAAVWAQRQQGDVAQVQRDLAHAIEASTRAVLDDLYPGAAGLANGP